MFAGLVMVFFLMSLMLLTLGCWMRFYAFVGVSCGRAKTFFSLGLCGFRSRPLSQYFMNGQIIVDVHSPFALPSLSRKRPVHLNQLSVLASLSCAQFLQQTLPPSKIISRSLVQIFEPIDLVSCGCCPRGRSHIAPFPQQSPLLYVSQRVPTALVDRTTRRVFLLLYLYW